MSKEAKIGIVVVGVLMGAFLGLLVKKYFLGGAPSAIDAASSRMAQQPAPIPTANQPTVVTAQNDAASRISDDLWANDPQTAPSAAAAGPPHGSYLPADDAAAPYNPNSRYARDEAAMPGEGDAPAPASENPLDRPIASDDRAENPEHTVPAPAPGAPEVAPGAASPLDARKPSGPLRNPLRRLSAEVPLDQTPTDADSIPNVDINAPANDEPDAGGGNQFAPQGSEEPLNLAPAAEPQPAGDRYRPQPSMDEQSDEAPAAAAEQEPNAYEPRVSDTVAPDTAAPGADQEPRSIAPQPTRPVDGRYTIRPNDSLWTISQNVYGDGRYFKAIGQHNRARLPQSDQLTAGMVIDVPPLATLQQNYPELCPKQRRSAVVKSRTVTGDVRPATHTGDDVYVVVEGDTLFDIARHELGKASRWGEIYELNRAALGEDFDFLPPGLELRMPPRGTAPRPAAPQPASRYER